MGTYSFLDAYMRNFVAFFVFATNGGSLFIISCILNGDWPIFQDPSPLSSQQSPSTSSPASWNQAIDPRLFSNGIATAPYPAQTTSTTSELANALSLPTPPSKAPPDTLQQPANRLGESYGNTKRPQWKMEGEAFDCEMASMRAIEDEKRKAKGLRVSITLLHC